MCESDKRKLMEARIIDLKEEKGRKTNTKMREKRIKILKGLLYKTKFLIWSYLQTFSRKLLNKQY